ncbi:MAG: DDE-type integrase/transposase/recombinase [Fibrobacteres bacterium]|nr:DDE-type integrase/transposase/recombinase [Fibrobacterota bacterium]
MKRLVHKVKANHPKWFQHLDVLPGEEAQMDFLEGPRLVLREASGQVVRRRTWILVLTLSHSAVSYREAILDQSARTVLAALMRGFEKFGGVPERPKIDNFKAAVIQAHRHDPVLHPLFQAWAGHYGILLSPCDPGCPQPEGVAWARLPVHEDGFLKGLPEIDSLDSLNERLRIWGGPHRAPAHPWTPQAAGPGGISKVRRRLHCNHSGSPFHLFEMGRRKVSVQGTVEVDSCHYEVSHLLIGQIVSVQYDAREVRVYRLHGVGSQVRDPPRPQPAQRASGPKGRGASGVDGSNAQRTRSLVPPWRIQGRAALQRLGGKHPVRRPRQTSAYAPGVLGIRDLERALWLEILETACSKMTPAPEASWHRLREL